MSQPLSRLALMSLLLMPAAIFAQGLEWSTAAGVTHYDNIDRIPEGGRNDTAANIWAGIKYDGQGVRHAEHLWAAGTYYNYLDDTYSDQIVGGIAGDALFQVVPDVVSWIVEDTYGPIVQDPLDSDTPDNLSYVNYFSTGPRLTLGAGRRTEMVFDGRYGTTSYSDGTPSYSDGLESADTTQVSGDLALVRQVSELTAWSVHAGGLHVSYDDAENSDYETYQGFVRYEGGSARSRIKADLGVVRLEYYDKSETNPLFALDLEQQLTKLTSLSVAYHRDYEDSPDRLGWNRNSDALPAVGQPTDEVVLAAPLREDFYTAALKFKGRRTTLRLGADHSETKYESGDALSQQKETDLYVWAKRELNDFLSLSLGAINQETKYEAAERKDTDNTFDAALTWQLGKRVALTGSIQYEKRDSTDNRFDYDTTITGIWISYSPSGEFL